jgi:hypothetical protein
MRNVLATIAKGLLFGIGFCIAAWGTYFVVDRYWTEHYSSAPRSATYEDREAATIKNLALSDLEEIRSPDGRVSIIGAVKNNGSKAVRNVEIEAELFQKGKFVDQYSTYLRGVIGPGESRNFKIVCGCKDTPPAEHDSYKVHLRSAYSD